MNTFGRRLRMHILGESHGHGVGVVLDGVPPGIPVDETAIQARMDQRRPGQSRLTTQRKEVDIVHTSTGVFEGHTTGAPVTLWIPNADARSKDYAEIRRKPRPGHSDLVARRWSRGCYDHRGGGHYSGRLTAPLVAAAAVVEPLLAGHGIRVGAHLQQVGEIAGARAETDVDTIRKAITDSAVHTACADLEETFAARVDEARKAKDSVGGVIEWRAEGVPPVLGDPFFDPVESVLAHLFFAVPAVKAVSFGAGTEAAAMRGSEHNDAYRMQDGEATPVTNHAGGVLGGRTTGAPLWGHVTVKPASSIFQEQETVDLDAGKDATLELKGRHDPCIAIRAVPVIRACVELVLADLVLLARQEGHLEAGA